MKLLLDEMYSPSLAKALRSNGHDVVAVAERGDLRGRADVEILASATSEGRALVTHNVKHFKPLAEQWQVEGSTFMGILFTSARSFPRSRDLLGSLISALDRYMAAHPADDALADSWQWLTE